MYILPGTYTGPFTLPNNAAIRGISLATVILAVTGATGNTDLITMGESCRLQDVTLNLQSSQHVELRGIVMPGTSTATSKIRDVVLNVDNSTASAGGTSNVYGIISTGTGIPNAGVQTLRGSTFNVASAGLGNKRVVYIPSASSIRARDANFILTGTGNTGGTWYGVETAAVGASFNVITSTIQGNGPTGATTADISQTLGTIGISTSNIINSNANNLAFTSILAAPTYLWADPGQFPNSIRYMRPGSGTSSSSIVQIRVSQKCLIKSLSVIAQTGPGAGQTGTFTIQRNGVDTMLTTTVSGTGTVNSINNTNSASFAAGDYISLKVTTTTNNVMSDVVATVDVI